MMAPQPPRGITDPPRAVSKKAGFASATTNPSYHVIALSSSRSSTCADATSEPPFVEVFGDLIDCGRPRQGFRVGCCKRADTLSHDSYGNSTYRPAQSEPADTRTVLGLLSRRERAKIRRV